MTRILADLRHRCEAAGQRRGLGFRHRQVPLEPELAVRLNGAVMLAGGVALALGLCPRLAAGALAGSLVPTTLAGHPYWRLADPTARRQQRIHFFKNVGLFGGALLVLAERPAGRR
jgi:putative oxidoreductase